MVQSVAVKYGETKAINPRFVNHIYPFNVKKFGLAKINQKFLRDVIKKKFKNEM